MSKAAVKMLSMQFTKTRQQRYLYLLTIVCSFVVFRLHNMTNPLAQNPDEADLLVSAMRASKNLIPYSNYSTTSYGYLWPLTLGLFGRLGVPLDFRTLHIVQGVISVAVLLILNKLLARSIDEKIALAITLVLSSVWSVQGFIFMRDLGALSTEMIPLLLICIATYLIAAKHKKQDLAFLLLGIAPWYKYQFLVLVIVLAVAYIFALNRKKKENLKSLMCFLAPTIFAFVLFALAGNLKVFMDEGFTTVISHATSLSFSDRFFRTKSFYSAHAVFLLPSLGLLLFSFKDWKKTMKFSLLTIHFAVFVTLQITPNFSDHYAYLLLAGAVASTIFYPVSKDNDRIGLTFLCVALVGYLAIANPISMSLTKTYKQQAAGSFDFAVYPEEEPTDVSINFSKELSEVCPPNSKVFIWGWTSEIYSYYRYVPVSRYIIAYSLLSYPQSNRYITLESELVKNTPDCILDTTSINFFGLFPSDSGLIENMPQIEKFLMQSYISDKATVKQLNSLAEVVVYRKRQWVENDS